MKMKYVQKPGFIADLSFVFSLAYNKDYLMSNDCSITENCTPDELNEIYDRFAPYPDVLEPFFHLKQDCDLFIGFTFGEEINSLGNDFTFRHMCESLMGCNWSIEKLIDYFFSEPLKYNENDISNLTERLPSLDIPDPLKLKLLIILTNPPKYMSMLVDEIAKKAIMLREYYEKDFPVLSQTQEQLDPDFIRNYFATSEKHIVFDENADCTYSLCLINSNHISCDINLNFIQLGVNYAKSIKLIKERTLTPDMTRLGKILSEPNRLLILDLILENGEMSTGDLGQILNLSNTVMYYHLQQMYEASMLKSRCEGRTFLYRINKEYFEKVREIFSKYTG